MIKRVKNTVRWPYVVIDLNGKEIVGRFYEIELQKKQTKKSLELKR